MTTKLSTYDKLTFQNGLVYDYNCSYDYPDFKNITGLSTITTITLKVNTNARMIAVDSEIYDLVVNFLDSVLGE